MGYAEPSSPETRMRRPLFGSLRARLIASHGFVLLLALALVLLISAGLLRRYEAQAEVARLKEIAIPLTVEVSVIPDREGQFRQRVLQLLTYQSEELGVRLLILRPDGRVEFDTAAIGNLAGQRLDAYARSIRTVVDQAGRSPEVRRLLAEREGGDDPLEGNRLVVAAGGRPRGQPQTRLVLGIAAPPERLPLIGLVLPRLLLVAGITLAVASVVGYLLSRRIAAPLGSLTRAADAMAAGRLEQAVPGEGPDELGRLVRSFNAMSRRVAATMRSQRELLSNIAHELRTPLTSVQGYAQAIRDGVIDSEVDQDRALATIGRESERMANLIGQLLDLARLESGQARLKLQPVALDPVLARVAERLAPEATRKGLTLETDAAPGLRVQGDEERLTQIITNLVANAVRHTPAAGRVGLTAAPLATPDGSGRALVRLTVQDTGEGIASDRLGMIFDRFERGEAKGEGFGLGLAIVRELVQLHGGTIAVQSRVGAGTTFTIDLPAAPAA